VTRETRVTIEPRDIRAIELECRACGLRATRPLEKHGSNLYRCPGCMATWTVEHQVAYDAFMRVVSDLNILAESKDMATPFVIRFEIPDQKEKP